MNDTKQVVRQMMVILFVGIAATSTCYYVLQITKELTRLTPTPTTTEFPTQTPIPTPTLPDTNLQAVVKDDGNCYSGTNPLYNILATIPQYQPVMIIRRNDAGDWLLIRWKNLIGDCWFEAFRLDYDFDINEVLVTSTPAPPTFTPTATLFVAVKSPTRSDGPNPQPPGSNLTNTSPPTNTSLPPTNTPVPPTNTPIPPPTNTPIPPSSTNTPVPPPTVCTPPNNPIKCP